MNRIIIGATRWRCSHRAPSLHAADFSITLKDTDGKELCDDLKCPLDRSSVNVHATTS